MTATFSNLTARPTLSVRAVYRSGSGTVDLDWPLDRIGEALADPEGTLWLDIEDRQGASASKIEVLFRDLFGFHPLAIEDALLDVNVPKLDDWEQYLYLVYHAIDFDPVTDDLRLRELDVFLAHNYLVTYRTEPMPAVEKVRNLIGRDPESRLKRRADHVLYLLIDEGVSEHLAAIEHLDEAIDDALDEIFNHPSPSTLQRIFQVKRSVARIHRVIGPQREVVNRLARDMYPQIGARDRVYFRDTYDSLVRLHDITESVRDLVSGALETYLSVTSNRTNEIMKALTIATVLFLPLNFVAGFFGMNFFSDNIVLDGTIPHTVLFALASLLMAVSAGGIWYWGRRRGWY